MRHTCPTAGAAVANCHHDPSRGLSLSAGHISNNMLSELLEAVLGAAYVDGGIPAVRAVFQRHYTHLLPPPGAVAAAVEAPTAVFGQVDGGGCSGDAGSAGGGLSPGEGGDSMGHTPL